MNASKHPEVQFFGERSVAARLADIPFRIVQAIADRIPATPEALALVDAVGAWVGKRRAANAVIEEVFIDGIRATWVRAPEVTSPRRTILHVHGGGFVIGTPEAYWEAAARLSAAADARVLVFDYQHPPLGTVADMTADCLAVYSWIVRRKSPGRLIVTGDSAGGNLAFGMLASARDAGLPMPAGLVAISAWLDPGYRHGGGLCDAFFPTRFAENAALLCHDVDVLPKALRPLEFDLSGFPPVLLQVGSTEPLADSNRTMASQLARSGVPVTLQLWNRQVHVFQLALGFLPESRAALAEFGNFADAVSDAANLRHLGVV